jgi:chemotaxis protein methyltransferase CheR
MTLQGPAGIPQKAAVIASMSDADFAAFSKLIHSKTGIVINEAKRSMLVSRLSRRLRELGLRFRKLPRPARLRQGVAEHHAFISAITTNVTSFFREPGHFEALAGMVPEFEARCRGRRTRTRIWSAGCSSGEEPYSIAMTLKENWPTIGRADVKILATDIDPGMVAAARHGVLHRLNRSETIPRPFCNRTFHGTLAANTTFRRSRAEGSNLRFEELNLLGQWPFNGMFDVIFCRNVVIYFDAPTRMGLWRRFAERLRPGGTLFRRPFRTRRPIWKPLLEPAGVTQYRRTLTPGKTAAGTVGRLIADIQQITKETSKNMSLKNSLQIMVVDDMSVSRGLIENALDEIGLRRVDFKTDGQSALRSLVGSPVHLVISDYNMPGMDGLGLLEALRRNKSTQRIGFILITGRADREVLTRGQQLGMNNFLTKPFSTQGLKTCIEQVVGVLH